MGKKLFGLNRKRISLADDSEKFKDNIKDKKSSLVPVSLFRMSSMLISLAEAEDIVVTKCLYNITTFHCKCPIYIFSRKLRARINHSHIKFIFFCPA